jgi:hypothetical protein
MPLAVVANADSLDGGAILALVATGLTFRQAIAALLPHAAPEAMAGMLEGWAAHAPQQALQGVATLLLQDGAPRPERVPLARATLARMGRGPLDAVLAGVNAKAKGALAVLLGVPLGQNGPGGWTLAFQRGPVLAILDRNPNLDVAVPMILPLAFLDTACSLTLSVPYRSLVLPEGLKVRGNLDLQGCGGLKALPAGLDIGGDLILNGCGAWDGFLPEDIQVGGGIDLVAIGKTAAPPGRAPAPLRFHRTTYRDHRFSLEAFRKRFPQGCRP